MKKIVKIIGLVLVIAMMFTACGEVAQRPVEAKLKTDLNDAYFTFSYGELREVIPSDKLAMLFESVNKKTDEKTVKLSYYELVSRFGGTDYFDDVIALAEDEELNMLTANGVQVLEYFNALINGIAKNDAVEIRYNENFKINHGDGVVFKDKNGNALENQDEFKAAFRIYADMALKNIDSYLLNYEEDDEKSNETPSEIITLNGTDKASLLTPDDLYSEDGGYPIYSSVIPTYSYDLDENGKNAEDENGEFIFVPTELRRTIVMTVKPDEKSVEKAFGIREKDGVMKELEKAKNYMTVNDYEVGFAPCHITAGVDAATDRMTTVTYEKNMVVTADVTFTGSLAQYGNVVVEFPCTSTLTYTFGWVAE